MNVHFLSKKYDWATPWPLFRELDARFGPFELDVCATAHKADLSTLPCIVSDATISRGSSGGALLNEYGRAVAVTTGAYVYGNNMYLCVPLDPVLEADLTGEGMTLQEVLDAVTAAREAAAAAAEAGESR